MDRQNKKSLATVLRHRLELQTKQPVSDGEGGFIEEYTTTYSFWGSLDPIKATQVFEYRSINVDATHLVKARGELTITNTQRIKFGTRYFEILYVEDIQERSILKVVTCKEVTA